MKKILFQMVILLSLVSTTLYAQPADKGLQIGDRMPDISMGQYLDAPNKKMKVSDFKGKLLIIDFWGIKCSVCIAHMPKMDSLQKQFGSKIQFVYVTRDDEKKVKEVLMKAKVKKPDVPFFISDKQFNKLFPHSGDPLHVWITPKGMVYAITQDYNTNEKTITEFLTGQNPIIPRRWDWGLNTDFPFVSEQNSTILGLVDSYSVWLTGVHNYEVGTGIRIRKNNFGVTTGLQLRNVLLDQLYGFAFMPDIFQVPINYFGLRKNNRVIFELKDNTVLSVPNEDYLLEDWQMNNLYSYELKLPEGSQKTIFDRLKYDIANKFPNYCATIEKRKENCLVLSDLFIEDQRNVKPPDSTKNSTILYEQNGITFQNMPMNDFLAHLIGVYSYYDTPFISESKYKGNLQMALKAKPFFVQQFNEELNKYGFQIKLEEREINMLVIRDRKNEIAAH